MCNNTHPIPQETTPTWTGGMLLSKSGPPESPYKNARHKGGEITQNNEYVFISLTLSRDALCTQNTSSSHLAGILAIRSGTQHVWFNLILVGILKDATNSPLTLVTYLIRYDRYLNLHQCIREVDAISFILIPPTNNIDFLIHAGIIIVLIWLCIARTADTLIQRNETEIS